MAWRAAGVHDIAGFWWVVRLLTVAGAGDSRLSASMATRFPGHSWAAAASGLRGHEEGSYNAAQRWIVAGCRNDLWGGCVIRGGGKCKTMLRSEGAGGRWDVKVPHYSPWSLDLDLLVSSGVCIVCMGRVVFTWYVPFIKLAEKVATKV
jgi:hypothetical protein